MIKINCFDVKRKGTDSDVPENNWYKKNSIVKKMRLECRLRGLCRITAFLYITGVWIIEFFRKGRANCVLDVPQSPQSP